VLRRPSIQIYEFAQLWRGLVDGGLEASPPALPRTRPCPSRARRLSGGRRAGRQEIVFVDDVWRFLNGEVRPSRATPRQPLALRLTPGCRAPLCSQVLSLFDDDFLTASGGFPPSQPQPKPKPKIKLKPKPAVAAQRLRLRAGGPCCEGTGRGV